MDVIASELLPTAYIFLKAVLEYPLKYGNRLVEDVKRWGEWITERLKEDEDIKELYDEDVAVYIGTWEVKCPHCGKWTPLVGNWWLARVKDSNGKYKRLAYMDYEKSGDEVEIKVVDVNKEVAKSVKGRLVDAIADAKVDTGKGEIIVNGTTYKVPSSNLNSRREQAICLNCDSLIRFVDADGNHYTDKKDVAKDERNELEWHVKWALKKYHEGDESYARQRLLVKVKVENRDLVFESCDERDDEKLEKAKEKINERWSEEEARKYAEGVVTYLGVALSRYVDYNTVCTTWNYRGQLPAQVAHTLTDRGIAMKWNWGDVSPFLEMSGTGTFQGNLKKVYHKVIPYLIVSFALSSQKP